MPPKRKARTTEPSELSLDPSLTPSNQDDVPTTTAGSSKRTKTTTGKSKSATISAERKEANRLAAERSRVRRATRAGILEQTAKGLAEENLVLKERIKKLVAMGVSVDTGVAVAEGLPEATGQIAVESENSGERSTPVLEVMTDLQQPDITTAAPTSVEFPPTVLRTSNKSSLQLEMETHFRNQIDELQTLLQEKREQLGSGMEETMEGPEDLETEHRQIQDINNRLQEEIRTLHDAISRIRADQAKAKTVNERLRTRVRETEAQLLVKEGVARTAADAGFRIDESRSDVQRAFKDLKRHLGLLIGHFNPGFIEPDLPEQEALVVPAPYESAPLPEPQKRGRPPLSKANKASSSRTTRKHSVGESMSPGDPSIPHDSLPAAGSSTGPGTKSSRAKKRYEPSKVRYRLDADPDVIYIEEREIIQNEDGEQEIVHVSKKPVYNPRPRSGAGRKPGSGKQKAQSVAHGEDELREVSGDGVAEEYASTEMERDVVMVDPSLESHGTLQTLHEAEGTIQTLHEAEQMA